MDHVMFDTCVRRAADLLHWRSHVGGLGAALSALGGISFGASAPKKHVRLCRADLIAVCEGNQECSNDLLESCKKAHKAVQKAADCRENEHMRDFRNRMRAIS